MYQSTNFAPRVFSLGITNLFSMAFFPLRKWLRGTLRPKQKFQSCIEKHTAQLSAHT